MTSKWMLFGSTAALFVLMVYVAVISYLRFAEIVYNQHEIIRRFEIVQIQDDHIIQEFAALNGNDRDIMAVIRSHDALLKQCVALWAEHTHSAEPK
jgi:hypothetical protein